MARITTKWNLGVVQYKDASIGNPIVEIWWSYNLLISTMGFPTLVRWHLFIESQPWQSPMDSSQKASNLEVFPCHHDVERDLMRFPLMCCLSTVHLAHMPYNNQAPNITPSEMRHSSTGNKSTTASWHIRNPSQNIIISCNFCHPFHSF